MKKRNFKRLLAIGFVAIFTASLAACNASSTPSGDDASKGIETEPNVTISEEDGPLVPFKDPVTITWGIRTGATQQFLDGDTYEENRWSKKLKDELNIIVEVAFSADGSTDAFDNKMNALLAAGDLPDIISTYDRNLVSQAYQAGYLTDLTDILDQYGTDSLKNYQKLYPASFEGAKINDRIYGFPVLDDNFHTGIYLWIRDDWLENTGSEPPKTLEEMIDLARKFTFNDPDQNDSDDTYGLMFSKAISENLVGFLAAYGVPAQGGDGIFYRGEDGKITYSFIQPEVRDVLSIVRDLYNEGIIDPEFIVKEGPQQETDIGNGTLGMAYYRNWGTWYPWNFAFQNDNVITRPYPVPTIKGTDYKIGVSNNAGGLLNLMNSRFEHPEAFVKILNIFNQTCFESMDPEDFQNYWADGTANLCPLQVTIPNELYAPQIHEALAAGSDTELPAVIQPFYQYVVDFESGADRGDYAYGTWGQMFSRGSMAIALEDYRNDKALIENVLGAQIPEIWLESVAVLQTIQDTAFTDIVIGNKDLDSFDAFVQDWLNNGGQKTLDELEILYPAN